MTTPSRTDAEALATFTRRLRPDWNHAGIVAAILACRTAALSETAVALIRMAEDGSVQTPGLLNTPGRWWFKAADQDRPAGEATRNRDRCPEHPDHDRLECPRHDRTPAHPDTIAAALAAAREAKRTARHKLDTEARARVERGAKP